MSEYDEAIKYFKQTVELNLNYKYRLIQYQDQFWIDEAYFKKKYYKKAIEHYTESLKISKKNRLPDEYMTSYYSIGASYLLNGQVEKSIAFTDSALTILDKLTNSLANENRSKFLAERMNIIELQAYNYFISGNNISLIDLVEKYRSLTLKQKIFNNASSSNFEIEKLQSLLMKTNVLSYLQTLIFQVYSLKLILKILFIPFSFI